MELPTLNCVVPPKAGESRTPAAFRPCRLYLYVSRPVSFLSIDSSSRAPVTAYSARVGIQWHTNSLQFYFLTYPIYQKLVKNLPQPHRIYALKSHLRAIESQSCLPACCLCGAARAATREGTELLRHRKERAALGRSAGFMVGLFIGLA